jgi:hypothetical protein
MRFYDKFEGGQDKLIIIIQPTDPKERPKALDTQTGELRDLTFGEWKSINPVSKISFTKENHEYQ